MDSYPQRKTLRLSDYDYSRSGLCFVTICAHDHRCLFSRICPREGVGALHEAPAVELTSIGHSVEAVLLSIPTRYPSIQIDDYVVMPNHLHILFQITPQEKRALREAPLQQNFSRSLLSQAVGYLKMNVSKQVHQTHPGLNLWQTRYHDHIVRNEQDYLRIYQYIQNNPARWAKDRYYTPYLTESR